MNREIRALSNVFLGTSMQAIGQLVFAFLTTRWLIPDQRGALILLLTVGNLCAALAIGGLAIEGRRRIAHGARNELVTYFRASFMAAGFAAVLSATLGVAVLWLGDSLLSWATAPLIVVMAASQALLFLLRAALYGIREFRSAVVTATLASLLQVVAVVYLHRTSHLDYLSAAVVSSIVILAPAVVLIGVYLHQVKQTGNVGRAPNTESSASPQQPVSPLQLFVLSLPAMPGSLMEQLLRSGDRILLGLVAGPGQVAVYGAGISMSTATNIIAMSSAQVIQTESAHDQNRQFGKHEKYVLAFTAVACFVVAATAYWTVPLLFGQQYADAIPVAMVGSYVAFMASLQRLRSAYFQGRGDHRRVRWNAAVGAVSMVALVLPLGAAYGAIGAATAMALSTTVMALLWLKRVENA